MKANKLMPAYKKGFAAASLLISMSSQEINAQHTDQVVMNQVVRLSKFDVKPDFQDAFQKAVSDCVNYSLLLESNILSEAYYEEDKPSIIWMIERWNDDDVFETIKKSAPYKTLNDLVETALLQPATTIEVVDLEPLSKPAWRTEAGANDNPITIMLFVDSKAGTEKTFEKVYHEAMPAFRSEAGVINYQLSRFKNDSTRFVTYEKFRNEEAFQYHLNFPPIKPVLEYLETSIRKPPFQDGIHRLIRFAPGNFK